MNSLLFLVPPSLFCPLPPPPPHPRPVCPVSPSDPHIQSFWRVLRSFTPGQRQQFLRFVWARSRLPTTSSEFTQKFKMQAAVAEVTGAVPPAAPESGAGAGGSGAGSGSDTGAGSGGGATSARPPSASASAAALAVVGTQLSASASTARGTSGSGMRSARLSFTTMHTVAAAAGVGPSGAPPAPGAPGAAAGSAPATGGIASAGSSTGLVRPSSHAALRGSSSEATTGAGAEGEGQVEVEGLPTTARRRPSSSRAGAAVLRSARRSFMRRPSMGEGLVGGAGRGFGPAVDVVTTPDAYLPKAHTCFFSLNLPKYSSDKVRAVEGGMGGGGT
jgi:hypothetical protein